MRVAILTTDNRAHERTYSETTPRFCTAPRRCRLAKPNLGDLGDWSEISLKGLFKQAAQKLSGRDDGAKLFQNLPANFW